MNSEIYPSLRLISFFICFSLMRRIKQSQNDNDVVTGKSDEGGYYKTYGNDAEGEKGFVKQTYSNGDHGYKSLDTFHKKVGDNYGFEEHTAFGKAKSADKGGRQAKSGAYTSKVKGDGDHEGAGSQVLPFPLFFYHRFFQIPNIKVYWNFRH